MVEEPTQTAVFHFSSTMSVCEMFPNTKCPHSHDLISHDLILYSANINLLHCCLRQVVELYISVMSLSSLIAYPSASASEQKEQSHPTQGYTWAQRTTPAPAMPLPTVTIPHGLSTASSPRHNEWTKQCHQGSPIGRKSSSRRQDCPRRESFLHPGESTK